MAAASSRRDRPASSLAPLTATLRPREDICCPARQPETSSAPPRAATGQPDVDVQSRRFISNTRVRPPVPRPHLAVDLVRLVQPASEPRPAMSTEDAAVLLADFVSSLDNLPSEVCHILEEISHKEGRVSDLRSRALQRDQAIQKHARPVAQGGQGLLVPNVKEESSTKKIKCVPARSLFPGARAHPDHAVERAQARPRERRDHDQGEGRPQRARRQPRASPLALPSPCTS